MIITAVLSLYQAQEDLVLIPWSWVLTILLKLLVLLLLKAGYCPEQSIELIEPAKFVKTSIKTDGESMLNKLNFLSAGGGNTFRLLKALYDNSLIHEIRKRVLEVKLHILAKSEWQDLMHELLFRQIQADSAFLSLIYFKY